MPPCLPTKAREPPCGDAWVHEIKYDGFRVIARKDGAGVKLYSRNGRDLTHRFGLIVEALASLRSRSCILDRRGSRSILAGQLSAPSSRCPAGSGTGIALMLLGTLYGHLCTLFLLIRWGLSVLAA
jgi:hypothetical protein